MPDPTPDTLLSLLQSLATDLPAVKKDLGEAVANITELVPLIANKDILGGVKALAGDVADIKRHYADLVAVLGKIEAVVATFRSQ